MREFVRRIAETLRVEFIEILELSADGQSLVLRAGQGWDQGSIGHVTVNVGAKSQAGFTLLAGEPVVTVNLTTEKRFAPPALLLDHHVACGMTVGIGGRENPYGVLGVHCKHPREFSAEDIHFLRTIANLLAAAVRGFESEQAQRDAASRVRAIVNTLVDGVITIDEHGRIETLNPAAETIFGYTAAELTGRNINQLMPEPYHSEHDGYVQSYLRTGRKRIIGIGREVSGLRKDGSIFPMDLAVSEFQIGAKRMFTGVVRDITDRRRMEREILEAGAAEQRRIGQDLHDGLCQHLAGIAFATEVLTQKLTARSAPEAASITKIGEMLDQAITQARDLARGLQPVTLDAHGLVDAMRALAQNVEQMFHVSCLFVCDGPSEIYDNLIATHLFRIAQEAISNAVKHGKARTIVLDLAITGDQLSLSIQDDGIGIKQPQGSALGMGLRSMDYRARLIGGTLLVRAGDKGGTTVVCTVRNVRVDGLRERVGHGKKDISTSKKQNKDSRRR